MNRAKSSNTLLITACLLLNSCNMYKKSHFLLSILLSFPLWLTPVTAKANANKCAELFLSLGNRPQTQEQQWADLYKKSDLSPRPQVWLRIRQALQKNVSHLEHPLESAPSPFFRRGCFVPSLWECSKTSLKS